MIFQIIFGNLDSDLTLNQWSTFELSQLKKGNDFVLSATVNGQKYPDVTNRSPRDYPEMNIYASRHWNPVPGELRNFVLITSDDDTVDLTLPK